MFKAPAPATAAQRGPSLKTIERRARPRPVYIGLPPALLAECRAALAAQLAREADRIQTSRGGRRLRVRVRA